MPSKAENQIRTELAAFGLESLTGWAMERYGEGYTEDQVAAMLPYQQAFKERFPDYWDNIGKGQFKSPAQMVAYEEQVRDVLNAMVGPEFRQALFGNPQQYANLRKSGKSVNEVQMIVSGAVDRVMTSAPVVKQEFSRMYGSGSDSDHALVAFMLNAEVATPIILQRARAAEASGLAIDVADSTISKTQAERIGQLGLDTATVRQEFSNLGQKSALFTEKVGEKQDLTLGDQGVDAAFGLDANAAKVLDQRRQQRLADSQLGGGVYVNKQGAVGLDVAN